MQAENLVRGGEGRERGGKEGGREGRGEGRERGEGRGWEGRRGEGREGRGEKCTRCSSCLSFRSQRLVTTGIRSGS